MLARDRALDEHWRGFAELRHTDRMGESKRRKCEVAQAAEAAAGAPQVVDTPDRGIQVRWDEDATVTSTRPR